MSQSVTVRDILTLYLRHCEVSGTHCPEARLDRERVFNAFAKVCGDMLVTEAKPFHLADWIESHTRWKSTSTRRAKANYIRAAFRWATEGGRIDRNPFLSVRYAEAERRPDMPDSTLERVELLSNKRYEEALRFLRLTACRLSELCYALWQDVDLDRGIWTIHKHKTRRHTKKPKLVPLVPEAVEMLRAMRQQQALAEGDTQLVVRPVDRPIFTNTRGTPWTRRTLGQQLRRLKRRHKIQEQATLHGVRHRMATDAIANGASVKLVAAALGHSSTQVTERFYCHNEQLVDGARDALGKGLPKK